MDVEKSQRLLPFSFFRNCETFFHKNFFHKSSPNSPILGNFEVHFAIFEPWIWHGLGPFPACLSSMSIDKSLFAKTSQLNAMKFLNDDIGFQLLR